MTPTGAAVLAVRRERPTGRGAQTEKPVSEPVTT